MIMALKTKQQEAFDYLSKTFPNMSVDGKAKLLGIWEGESNLEKSRSEDFPLYVKEGVKGFAGEFSAPFQSTSESYPNEDSIVKKYKTKKGSKQTQQLLKEERSLWVPPKDREAWYKNLKTKYNIPTFDSSKTHKENRTLQNKAIDKLTPEQKKSYEVEFFDKVYGSEYSTVKGGYAARGIGPIQVTGIDNIVKSLNTAAKLYNRPEWAELSKIVQNEPEKIDRLIRNNPELETALSMGYIQDNLVTKEGDLKAGSLKEINTIVNKGNGGYDEKNKAYTEALSALTQSKEILDAQKARATYAQTDPRRVDLAPQAMPQAPQPAPQAQPTYDYIPQQPVPYTPSAPMSDFEQPQYATMEDLLADRGLMGTRGL
jgi:hypothetical protein